MELYWVTKQRTAPSHFLWLFTTTYVNIPLPNDIQTSSRAPRGNQFVQLQPRIDAIKFSFCPNIIQLWNSLPDHVTSAKSLEIFKVTLVNYLNYYCIILMQRFTIMHDNNGYEVMTKGCLYLADQGLTDCRSTDHMIQYQEGQKQGKYCLLDDQWHCFQFANNLPLSFKLIGHATTGQCTYTK